MYCSILKMLTDKYITLSLLLQLLNFINETLGTIPVIYMSSTTTEVSHQHRFCFHFAEIARQAAQMKLMRKLEKQALARAAKEARKQQGKRVQGCKHAGGGYLIGQSVTSDYFDLNQQSIKPSKNSYCLYSLCLHVGSKLFSSFFKL